MILAGAAAPPLRIQLSRGLIPPTVPDAVFAFGDAPLLLLLRSAAFPGVVLAVLGTIGVSLPKLLDPSVETHQSRAVSAEVHPFGVSRPLSLDPPCWDSPSTCI